MNYNRKRKTPADYEHLEDEEVFKIAKKRALYLLGGKSYTEHELLHKLNENYPPHISLKVIDTVKGYGYIDDEKYSKDYAKKLVMIKKYGENRVLQEMKRKGFSGDDINNALAVFCADDYREIITDLIKNKYGFPEDDKEYRRTVSSLVRRGFSFSEITSAMKFFEEK